MEADRVICRYYMIITIIGQFRYGLSDTSKIRNNLVLPFNLIIYCGLVILYL
jgi:hypothetical protein